MAQSVSRQEARRDLMLNSPIHSVVPKMAIPTVISMLVMSLYSLADTYFVSSLGTAATGAVGVNSSLEGFIQMAGSALAIGSNSYIARLLGAKRDKEAQNVLSVGFFTALFTGLLMAIFGMIFMDGLVSLLGAKDGDVVAYAKDYASYVLLAAPFMTAQFVMNQCLRAEGSSTFSMIGMVCGAFINIALDPLFIFVFGMGVKGAGLATAISKLISFCVLLTPYLRRHTLLRISIRNYKPTKAIVGEMAKMGSPTFVRQALMTLANILTNNMASAFGPAALAAMSVCNRVMMFVTSAILGFGQGYQPVAGFNWGAKRYDRVWSAYWFASIVGTAALTVLSIGASFFAEGIIGLFNSSGDADVLRYGAFNFRMQCYAMPIHAWVIVVNMTYAGLGKAKGAAVLSLSRQGICFFPLIFTLPRFFGAMGLCACQGAADMLSLALGLPLAISILREIRRLQREHQPETIHAR